MQINQEPTYNQPGGTQPSQADDRLETGTDDLYEFHPGATIKFDYAQPLNLSTYRLAKALQMGQTHVADIMGGKRSVTANIAIRLAKVFDTTPQYWLNMQNHYDMRKPESEFGGVYERIERMPVPA